MKRPRTFFLQLGLMIVLALSFSSCQFPDVLQYREKISSVRKWIQNLPTSTWKEKLMSFASRGKQKSAFIAKDTVIFKNGGMIQCIIVERTPQRIRISLEDGTVAFPMADISDIRFGQTLVKDGSGIQVPVMKASDDGVYPRIYLKNGNIVYGNTISKEGGIYYLKEAVEGGGNVSYGFKFDEIEKLRIWKPPAEDAVDKSFKGLRKGNLKFFNKKPPYYILSTVEPSDAVMYFNALDRFYGDFLLTFFDLIDPSKPHGPLAVVLFGDYENFIKVCNLPPKTYIAGFYMPKDRTLRLYNVKETAMVNYQIKGAEWVGQQISKDKTMVEKLDSDRYEGKWQVYDQLEKIEHDLEKRRMRLENMSREWTIQVIRHEACHQLMHALGYTDPDRYAGAWISEGFSDYVAPENMGDVNRERLMYLKKQLDEGQTLMPLQYLVTFKSGSGKESVHKLAADYAIMAYAESWAFVYFLMNKYPEAFLTYLKDLKQQDKKFDGGKDVLLIEKHMGKKLGEIDKEFEGFTLQLIKEKIDSKEYSYYRFFNPLSLFPAPEK